MNLAPICLAGVKTVHVYISDKYTKHQFIHLLTALLKNSHIEDSKNHKKWYCPHHTDCVSCTPLWDTAWIQHM